MPSVQVWLHFPHWHYSCQHEAFDRSEATGLELLSLILIIIKTGSIGKR